ncbi:hypothetical protein ACLM5H_14450 [Fredinandcohnia humi]
MKVNFNRLFWGFILIFLEIHIFIDLLPDPVGYYLIFSGVNATTKGNRNADRIKILASILIIVSIPTVVVQQTVGMNAVGHIEAISLWFIYTTILAIVKLILVFFVFQFIMEIVMTLSDEALIKRSSQAFKVYMVLMLIITFSHSFVMNIWSDLVAAYLLFTIPISIGLEIMFLVLLRKLHKHEALQ